MLKDPTIAFVILVSLVMAKIALTSMNVKLGVTFAMTSVRNATTTGAVMTADVLKDSLAMEKHVTIVMNVVPYFTVRVSKRYNFLSVVWIISPKNKMRQKRNMS